MPVYAGKNPHELLSLISARTDASGFYATGYGPQITGLVANTAANHHIPGSYTNLRAHVTVLDLVSRLLMQ